LNQRYGGEYGKTVDFGYYGYFWGTLGTLDTEDTMDTKCTMEYTGYCETVGGNVDIMQYFQCQRK